jgi:hypothetical protein
LPQEDVGRVARHYARTRKSAECPWRQLRYSTGSLSLLR